MIEKRNVAGAALSGILGEVASEIERARDIHGVQHDLPLRGPLKSYRLGVMLESAARYSLDRAPCWTSILAEEVGESMQAETIEELRAELVQVAAVAVCFVDRIDAGHRGGRRLGGVD